MNDIMNREIERDARCERLTLEAMEMDRRKETLINSAIDFEGKTQADYFSNMRNNLNSDMAYEVMNFNHQLEDLIVMRGL